MISSLYGEPDEEQKSYSTSKDTHETTSKQEVVSLRCTPGHSLYAITDVQFTVVLFIKHQIPPTVTSWCFEAPPGNNRTAANTRVTNTPEQTQTELILKLLLD